MRLKTDHHRVLELVAAHAGRQNLTIAEIASGTGLTVQRTQAAVSGLVGDGALEHCGKTDQGHAWLLNAVGRTALARLEASFTGKPFVRPQGDDDGWKVVG